MRGPAPAATMRILYSIERNGVTAARPVHIFKIESDSEAVTFSGQCVQRWSQELIESWHWQCKATKYC